MPANGRRDLIQRLKVNLDGPVIIVTWYTGSDHILLTENRK